MLTVHRNSGDTVSVDVKPDVGVSALKPAKLSDARVGSYVGTPALMGSDGKLTATSMIVFPEAARGTAEGHFPYDFGPNSTMTNANVVSVVTDCGATPSFSTNSTCASYGARRVATQPMRSGRFPTL